MHNYSTGTFVCNYFEFGPSLISKDFSIFSTQSGSHFVQQSGAILANLEEGVMENIYVKLLHISASDLGEKSHLKEKFPSPGRRMDYKSSPLATSSLGERKKIKDTTKATKVDFITKYNTAS